MKKITTLLALAFLLPNIVIGQYSITGPSAYWPFNGNVNDSSGHGNNGIVHGATLTSDRFGNCNQAYRFNGVNSYITVPNSPTVDMGGTDFTIAFWIKTYANDTAGNIINKNQYGSWSGYIFATNLNNPGYCTTYKHADFYVAAGAHQDVCSDSAICKDTSWHFITGLYKYITNQAYLYVDGVLQSTVGQSSGSVSSTTDLVFGAASIYTVDFFNGVLDAVRMYQRALSPAEILQLYNEPNPGNSCNVSGIQEIISSNKLSIYPNPNNGFFVIEPNAVAKQTVMIYDATGKIVLSQTITGKTSIDASGLNEGVYNISMNSSEGVLNKRLVIVK